METIHEAKEYLKENWKAGAKCPCCDQLVKLYPRKMTGAVVWALGLIYKYFRERPREDWVHVENHFKTLDIPASIRGDFAKLAYWELIEAKREARDDGNPRNGYWRITAKGVQFFRGQLEIPDTAFVYNDTIFGFSETMVKIKDVLNNKFDYNELMGNYPAGQEPKAPTYPYHFVKDLGERKLYTYEGSLGKIYNVVEFRGTWSCTCEAFKFSTKHICKHIENIKKALAFQKRQAAATQQRGLF